MRQFVINCFNFIQRNLKRSPSGDALTARITSANSGHHISFMLKLGLVCLLIATSTSVVFAQAAGKAEIVGEVDGKPLLRWNGYFNPSRSVDKLNVVIPGTKKLSGIRVSPKDVIVNKIPPPPPDLSIPPWQGYIALVPGVEPRPHDDPDPLEKKLFQSAIIDTNIQNNSEIKEIDITTEVKLSLIEEWNSLSNEQRFRGNIAIFSAMILFALLASIFARWKSNLSAHGFSEFMKLFPSKPKFIDQVIKTNNFAFLGGESEINALGKNKTPDPRSNPSYGNVSLKTSFTSKYDTSGKTKTSFAARIGQTVFMDKNNNSSMLEQSEKLRSLKDV